MVLLMTVIFVVVIALPAIGLWSLLILPPCLLRPIVASSGLETGAPPGQRGRSTGAKVEKSRPSTYGTLPSAPGADPTAVRDRRREKRKPPTATKGLGRGVESLLAHIRIRRKSQEKFFDFILA